MVETTIISSQSSNVDSLIERLNRIVFTHLHSRVILYHFGSLVPTIIDETLTVANLLKFKKYLFDCFYDEKGELWDKDFDPISIAIDTENLVDYAAAIKFRDGTEVQFG